MPFLGEYVLFLKKLGTFNIAWNMLVSRGAAHLLSHQYENQCQAPVIQICVGGRL
jgi:hypothetical protein